MRVNSVLMWPLLASAPIVQPAYAQDPKSERAGESLETGDIVVTATRRAESIQRVPVSITAFDETAIASRGIAKLEDYSRLAPGLVYTSNGANGGTFAIRGINTSTLAGNTQSPVAVYYDDLPALNSYAPLVTPDLRLFDIERIEVLRGPQGTLFGSGALGGAVRVITNKPDRKSIDARGEATVMGTEWGDASYALNGMINLPIVDDKIALRAVGYWQRDGGWVDNPTRGQVNVNSQDSWGGRVTLAVAPTDGLEFLASITHQDDDPQDSAYSFYAGPARSYDARTAQVTAQQLTVYNLTARLDAGTAIVTSTTSYADQDQTVSRDLSAIIAAALGIADPAPYKVTGPSEAFSQEVRIASAGDGPLTWLVGGFYLHNKRDIKERLNIPGAGALLAPFGFPSDDLFLANTNLKTSEKALFGEISYALSDRLTATVGLRAFWNEIRIGLMSDGILGGGPLTTARRQKENAITPKFALRYQVNPDVMLYGQAAKGYRIGQLNLGPAIDPISSLPIPTSYGPDSLWNYELGVKSTFWDRRISLNIAAYYIDWRDIQLQDQSAAGFQFIDNSGRARSRGLEIEARITPLEGLQFGTSLSVAGTRMTDVDPGFDARVGDRLPAAPNFTIADFAEYSFAVGDEARAYVRADHQYRGKAFSNLNNPTSPSFGDFHVLNVRLGVDLGRLELVGFVNNLADSDGKQSAVVLPGGPAAVRLRPRTYGLTVRASY